MSELLDQIEARIEALTQPDDHPKRALFAVGDVARLLAAVRAVERVIRRAPDSDDYLDEGERGYRSALLDIRRALTEALEGEA